MVKTANSLRLTKRVIDQADPSLGRHYLWDSELRGFGVCVEASGTRTYFVRYRLKGLGRDGTRRFYKIGRHGNLTADEAREQAKVILGQVASGRDPAAERLSERRAVILTREAATFQNLADQFLREHVACKRKKTTAVNYEILIRRHAAPSIGERKAHDVTRVDVAALHAAMGAKPYTANRLLAVISSMYVFAAKRALVPEGINPAKGIERYREEGRERYLTSHELQRLGTTLMEAETIGIPWVIDEASPNFKHTPKEWKGQREQQDPFAVAAIRLLIFTGARLGEILNLRWEHVDLERGLLFLPDSKTGKKTIVLNVAAMDVITSIAGTTAANETRNVPRRTGYVIKGGIEDRPRTDLKRPWKAIRRHAELGELRLHDLRHTFASIGAGASLGLPIVGKLLGHSQPQTTARYAHLDADPLRRAANIIGDQLSVAMAGQAPKFGTQT